MSPTPPAGCKVIRERRATAPPATASRSWSKVRGCIDILLLPFLKWVRVEARTDAKTGDSLPGRFAVLLHVHLDITTPWCRTPKIPAQVAALRFRTALSTPYTTTQHWESVHRALDQSRLSVGHRTQPHISRVSDPATSATSPQYLRSARSSRSRRTLAWEPYRRAVEPRYSHGRAKANIKRAWVAMLEPPWSYWLTI